MALRGREVAKSRLGGTVTKDKLTSTSAVEFSIITVRAMLSRGMFRAGNQNSLLQHLVCGNVVMMLAVHWMSPGTSST